MDIDFGVYATNELRDEIGDHNPFESRWIGFVSSLSQTPIGSWLKSRVDSSRFCLRCDSFVSIRQSAEAGIGIALLPRLLGETSSLLVEIPADTLELTIGLWALAHPDLARSARVHAFIEHLVESLAPPGSG